MVCLNETHRRRVVLCIRVCCNLEIGEKHGEGLGIFKVSPPLLPPFMSLPSLTHRIRRHNRCHRATLNHHRANTVSCQFLLHISVFMGLGRKEKREEEGRRKENREK